MKTIIKILVICSILFIGTLQAQEQYSKENITKHLKTIFKNELKYEQKWIQFRYAPFSNKFTLYLNFSPSIKEQQEKISIIKDMVKKFETIIKSTIIIKLEKPPVEFIEENNQVIMKYIGLKSYFKEFIYFDFANRNEIFAYLNEGFWNKKVFGIRNVNDYTKYFNFLNQQEQIILFEKTFNNYILRHFHLIELNNSNNTFENNINQILFYTLLGKSFYRYTNYIKPSIFNNTGNDISKKELSKFDWILFDEFYNNKDLKLHMLYKTEVIPILTEAIYNRVNTKDKK